MIAVSQLYIKVLTFFAFPHTTIHLLTHGTFITEKAPPLINARIYLSDQ